jgi:PAS domain S-box-containing protein
MVKVTTIRNRLDKLPLSTRISLGVLIIITVVTFVMISIVSRNEIQHYHESIHNRLQFQADVYTREILHDIDTLQKEVLYLSKTPPIQGIIRATMNDGYDAMDNSSLKTWKKRLQNIFIALLAANNEVMQVRYIGAANSGLELVRINRFVDGDGYELAQGEQLQAKADRDYFQATMALAEGEMYLSEINLNREGGKVQVPHVRTLRVASPVYSNTGELFGMVVINFNIGRTLDRFSITQDENNTQTYLMNNKGDYLVHPDSSKTFGFDRGQHYRWTDDVEETGLASDDIEQYARELIYLNLPDGEAAVYLTKVYFDAARPHRALTMALAVPGRIIDEKIATIRNLAILGAFGVTFVMGVLFFLYVHRTFRPLRQLTLAAKRIGKGQYDTSFPAHAGGELTTLMQAFDKMQDGIRQREDKILSLNRSLDEKEKYANYIIEAVPEVILVVDENGCIARVNDRVEQVLGYSGEELVGQPVETLIPAHLGKHHEELRQNYFNSDMVNRMMGAANTDLYALRKDGKEINVEVGLGPMVMNGQRYVIATLHDVSKRRAMENAIRQSASELARSNEELEQFAYVASHDLQEPLRMVSSYMKLVEKRYHDKLDKDGQEFIDFAVDGAQRMQSLIKDLLSYSRVGRKDITSQPVDLNKTMADVMHDLELKLQDENATVEFSDLPVVMGDPGQIHQLMQNLVNNGVKFHKEEAPRVTITARSKETSDSSSSKSGASPRWEISVKDNGIGFKQEYAGRIFDIFQRLHNHQEFKGTGIGLAVCRKIVERHGGQIKAISSTGNGAEFVFDLQDAGQTDV